MYLYLQLLIIFVVIPNAVLLYVNRKELSLKTLLISLIILFCVAVLWDQLSVRMGIWMFSPEEIVGTVFGLPLEEYLFFLFVPLLSINIFVLMGKLFTRKETGNM